ncbi:MAG: hypothetical protein NC342_00090 [Pseudoflavonifractor sp.]|nr:hypothetical protein [Alloprevotella sp.]MCM1115927.1 hypothetical protein [Pseudoflavonifractor sp.]
MAHSSTEILSRLINEPGVVPSREEATLLAADFPYLTLPAALRLQRAPGLEPDERRALIGRVAAGTPGRDALFRLLDPDGALLSGFMPPEEAIEPTATTTDSAIDTFLSTYGRMSEREEALLEKMIFNPVPDDYVSLLASEGAAPEEPAPETDSQDSRLDAFLASQAAASHPDPQPAVEAPKEAAKESVKEASKEAAKAVSRPEPLTPGPETSLSESLAQVYIRRGRYDKAYDIIHALSLNNPKKSVYFADQLRFLQKLMLVERCRKAAANKP